MILPRSLGLGVITFGILQKGTSLAVYPAAMLVRYAKPGVPVYVVDPGEPDTSMIRNPLTHIKARAAEGMPQLAESLKDCKF